MSNVVKAIVGVVAVAAGVFFDQPWLIQTGAVLLLNAAATALGPKPPRAPPLSGIQINYSGTLEPRRILYGEQKIGGINVVPPC